MANMVAAYGKKRFPRMFATNDGMLAAPTTASLRLIRGKNAKSRCTGKTKRKLMKMLTGEVHPVTESNEHYCLFDRLHEKKHRRGV